MIRTSLRVLVVAGGHSELREFSVSSRIHGPFTRSAGLEAGRIVTVTFTRGEPSLGRLA